MYIGVHCGLFCVEVNVPPLTLAKAKQYGKNKWEELPDYIPFAASCFTKGVSCILEAMASLLGFQKLKDGVSSTKQKFADCDW